MLYRVTLSSGSGDDYTAWVHADVEHEAVDMAKEESGCHDWEVDKVEHLDNLPERGILFAVYRDHENPGGEEVEVFPGKLP